MKLIRTFGALSLVLGLAVHASRAADRTETWAFESQQGVKISTFKGAVSIEASADEKIHVTVTAGVAVEDQELAQKALSGLRYDWSASEGVRELKISNPGQSRIQFSWHADRQASLAIKVAIPAKTRLEVSTDDGAIQVGRVAGVLNLRTERGLIFCQVVDGSLTARTGEGDIVLSRCTGDADLTTLLGCIETGTILGKAKLSAVSGDINVMSARGGLVAKVDGGDVSAGVPPGLTGEYALDSGGGNVTLRIDPRASIALQAASSWGKVINRIQEGRQLDFYVTTGAFDSASLNALLNSGGPVVQARARGGHVIVTAEPTPFY